MELIFAAILGLLVGAVVSVVSVRLPRSMQRETENFVALVSGNEPVHQPYAVLPLAGLAQLFSPSLRTAGACLGCALLSVAAISRFGVTPAGIAVLCFTYLLAALVAVDLEAQLLPDSLTYPLMWLGLLVNIEATFVSAESAIIGAVAGYVVLCALATSFKAVTKTDGMGNGDFKLMAALCAWHGYQILFGLLTLAFLAALSVWIVRAVISPIREQQSFAFGPYLAVAGLAAFYVDAFKAFDLFGF